MLSSSGLRGHRAAEGGAAGAEVLVSCWQADGRGQGGAQVGGREAGEGDHRERGEWVGGCGRCVKVFFFTAGGGTSWTENGSRFEAQQGEGKGRGMVTWGACSSLFLSPSPLLSLPSPSLPLAEARRGASGR